MTLGAGVSKNLYKVVGLVLRGTTEFDELFDTFNSRMSGRANVEAGI